MSTIGLIQCKTSTQGLKYAVLLTHKKNTNNWKKINIFFQTNIPERLLFKGIFFLIKIKGLFSMGHYFKKRSLLC